jgi:hypothetical protein
MVCERKSQKQRAGMSSSEYVDRARGWADALVWRETSGPRQLDEARSRVEARYGIPFSVLKDLRERPPKRIAADLYERLRSAYLASCERIVRSAQNDMAVLKSERQDNDNADLASLGLEAEDLASAIQSARDKK